MIRPDVETPAFVIDGDALFERAREISGGQKPCEFCYSVKTLPVAEAVLLASQGGWLTEVVSREEFDFVCGLGIDVRRIVLNGPTKDDRLIEAALEKGAIVHADSLEELWRAARLCSSADGMRLGARLGLGITDPRWARFGIDASKPDSAIRSLAALSSSLPIRGFHVHSGTNRTSLQEFRFVAARTIEFASAYSAFTGVKVEWIDLGGGFADRGAPPLSSSNWRPPSIEEFVSEGCAELEQWEGPRPALMFEPGRALVGAHVDLYSKVETVKSVAGVQVVTLDAGVNILPFARAFAYPVDLCEESHSSPVQTVICGPLCMSDDVIRADVMLPPLQAGMTLRIRGVGAYNFSMSYNFIRARARIFMRHKGATVECRAMFSSS